MIAHGLRQMALMYECYSALQLFAAEQAIDKLFGQYYKWGEGEGSQ